MPCRSTEHDLGDAAVAAVTHSRIGIAGRLGGGAVERHDRNAGPAWSIEYVADSCDESRPGIEGWTPHEERGRVDCLR